MGVNTLSVAAFTARAKAITLRGILVAVRPYYARVVSWWESREVLRKRVAAFRVVALRISRNAQHSFVDAVNTVMTEQVQSRDELATMSPAEIMHAWRDGRLKWLMRDGNSRITTNDYYDKTFGKWAHDGGQRRP